MGLTANNSSGPPPLDYHPGRRAVRDPTPASDGQAFGGMILSAGVTLGILAEQRFHLLFDRGWPIRPLWAVVVAAVLACAGALFYRTRNWPSFGVGLWVGLGIFGLIKTVDLFLT